MPAGQVDLAKTCEDHKGAPVFARSGKEVGYLRCTGCGFVWCPEMCLWDRNRFRRDIYNEDYIKADPDYVSLRPEANARWLTQFAGEVRSRIQHLDYGGGDGLMASLLCERGFRSHSWDPMEDPDIDDCEFDLVTAFEVFEHSPDPQALRMDIMRRMLPDGVLLFSTMTSDRLGRNWHPAEWWYAAPRNGHVCLYTKDALRRLFAPLTVFHMSEGLHLAASVLPSWLNPSLQ